MRVDRLGRLQRRVLDGVVDLLLPAYPPVVDAARRRAALEATRFVAVQVGNIPALLRLPYLAAILVFHWLALPRYGRPFLSLRVDARRAYLAWWTDSPVGPMRDFVRLIRGCALLSYFDQDEIRRAVDANRGSVMEDDAAEGARRRRVADE